MALPVACIAALALIFFLQVRRLHHAYEQVDRSGDLLSLAYQVENVLREIETSEQAYGITGDSSFLRSWKVSVASARKLVIAMKEIVPEGGASAAELGEIVKRFGALEARPRPATRATSEASAKFMRLRGRAWNDLHLRVSNLVATVEGERDHLVFKEEGRTHVTYVAGLGLLTLLGVTVVLFTRKQFLRIAEVYNGALSSVETQARRLEIQARNLEAANHAKTLFLANMSHEMRTPLSAIVGFADLALLPNQSASEVMDAVVTVQRNARQLSSLISDLLDISKIEAGKLQIEKTFVPFAALMDEVQVLFRSQARTKGVEFEIRYQGELPEFIFTDSTRLRQILTNLVGNSLKFTERGRVTVSIAADGNTLTVRVADTGVGIPENRHTELFRPFVQADNSSTRRFGGSGLGLALSLQIARALGGNLVLEKSVAGQGSVFCLTLPLEEKTTLRRFRDLAREKAAQMAPEVRLDGMRILLAEDSPDMQVLIRKILEGAGARVELAANGHEALARALESPHDVVLMDIQMPGIDGLEVTRRLRERDYKGPIIALTAHASETERQRCFDAGCVDHFAKPVDRIALLARLGAFHTGRPAVSSPSNASEAPVS